MAGDLKLQYASSVAFTFTTGTAGSSGFTSGRTTNLVANTTTEYLDALIGGTITWSSTAPAAGSYYLYVYAIGAFNDTPSYPVNSSSTALTGDAAFDFGDALARDNGVRLGAVVQLTTTASRVYTFAPFSLASLFGGVMPTHFGLWIVHGVTTASSATASGTNFYYTPIHAQYT